MVHVIVQDKIKEKNYFIIETGQSFDLQKEIIAHLQKQRLNLKEVHSVEDCDVILDFCPIVSRAGTDIDAAVKKLDKYEASKPAIFMVFHLTFDPDKIIPDSSRYIKRSNTLTVDYLFSEEEGLLKCDKNTEALTKIVHCFKYQGHHEIQQRNKWNMPLLNPLFTCLTGLLCWTFDKLESNFITRREKNYFIIETGQSFDLQKEIVAHLQKQRLNLKEVHSVEDCDVILDFCPIVSRAGTDIDAAVKKLDKYEASKPAIFMVFHLTYDPDKIIPDSSEYIKRSNTLTVDYLFSEEEGLLKCDKNTEALTKIAHCFKYQGHHEIQQRNKWNMPLLNPLFTCLTGLLCWTFDKLESIWNFITRRGTRESSTVLSINEQNKKRNRLKDTDEEKNV